MVLDSNTEPKVLHAGIAHRTYISLFIHQEEAIGIFSKEFHSFVNILSYVWNLRNLVRGVVIALFVTRGRGNAVSSVDVDCGDGSLAAPTICISTVESCSGKK